MALGDIVQVTVNGEIDGQRTANVLHFKDQVVATGDESTLAQAVMDCVTSALLTGLTTDYKLTSVSAKRILPTVGNEVILVAPGGSAGSIAGSLPSFNAAVISLRSNRAGKSGRGRMYIAGIPNSGESASQVSSTLQAVLAAFITCLVGKFVGLLPSEGFNWGIFSRKNYALTPGTESTWWSEVTQAVVNSDIGTMRSRKLKVGV